MRSIMWRAVKQSKRRCSVGGSYPSVDALETAKFEADAERWWDTRGGPFAALHAMNPARCGFIRDALCRAFNRDPSVPQPLEGLRLLDVGCGGGLLVEPLARLGAEVLGCDAVGRSIAVAQAHARRDPVVHRQIVYRAVPAEQLVTEGVKRFDGVLSLEVIEHTADAASFVRTLAALRAPGGVLVLSTLNRSLRAYAVAILAAEKLLQLVPPGTHDWARFLTPEELALIVSEADAGLYLERVAGIVPQPLSRTGWVLSPDTSVNYIASWTEPRVSLKNTLA